MHSRECTTTTKVKTVLDLGRFLWVFRENEPCFNGTTTQFKRGQTLREVIASFPSWYYRILGYFHFDVFRIFYKYECSMRNIDGLVQDCSNSIVLATLGVIAVLRQAIDIMLRLFCYGSSNSNILLGITIKWLWQLFYWYTLIVSFSLNDMMLFIICLLVCCWPDEHRRCVVLTM